MFESLPITPESLSNLRSAIVLRITSTGLPSGITSGIVIAGFGTAEHFPALEEIKVAGRIDPLLQYWHAGSAAIGSELEALIIPFAQDEMVHRFMQGIDPIYKQDVENDLRTIFNSYPELIVESIATLTDEDRVELKRKLKVVAERELTSYLARLQKYQRAKYVDPVLNLISYLPKDELAAMAESFVNLTSFKRKFSMELETVGGPIDVCVITKGDGLIWIKRKHYFRPELNKQFFENYYRR